MPGVDHFDGHANLTQGQRRSGAPILSELLGASESVRHVDLYTLVAPEHQDGSASAPYSTIQAAVDDFEARVSPTVMGTVLIAPGTYPENVVIRKTLIRLFGIGGRNSTFIIPASGVAITITNATAESLAVYRVSADYADLVNDGPGPLDIELSNLYWDDGSYVGNGLELLGVKGDASPTTTDFLDGGVGFTGFQTWSTNTSSPIYARNVGYYQQDYHLSASNILLYNYGDIRFFNNSRVVALTCEYDPTSPYGNSSRGTNWVSLAYSTVETLTLNKQARTKDKPSRCTYCEIDDVVVNDTGTFNSYMNYIYDSIVCAGGASYAGVEDHIGGDLTFATGAGTAQLNGGRYMGSLTDPDVKFVHSLGNIGT
jgi:hypothetical protein